MTPERYARLQALFFEARELDTGDRSLFLSDACGSDVDLRAEVEGLIASDTYPRHRFDAEELDAAAELVRERATSGAITSRIEDRRDVDDPEGIPRWVPRAIGPYRIVRLIGVGGMGLVFEALQLLPERRVAIKVLRPSLRARSYLRRFRVEAEALGRLTHPGIARIYGTGDVESVVGRLHYFVLELVEGRPLLAWAHEHELDVEAKCRLMVDVIDAVHEAHLRSVVHRDLKPANVLVDADGRPRVLDFGVALLVDRDLRTATRTLDGQLVGTLPYMSPEQARGDVDAIDLRTDVYSLGCVFYELLCGVPAIDGGSSMAGVTRRIEETVPVSAGVRDPRLRGDLETILAKAMAKEKEDRYASAAAFASDVRRFLAFEPIEARPPSAMYQLRRFVRRNRAQVAFAATATVLVLASAALALFVELRQRSTQAIADARAEDLLRREELRAVREAAEFVAAGVPRRALEVLEEVRPVSRGWEWSYLEAACRPPTRTVASTEGTLFYQHVSRDGARLATGGIGGTILVVDTRASEVVERIVVDGEVRALDISPSGERVAGLAWHPERRSGRLFVVDAGAVRYVDERPSPNPWGAVRFAPDGERLAWSWDDGTLAVYDLPSATLRFRVRTGARPGTDLTYSSDGEHIATRAYLGDAIRVWNASTGELERAFVAAPAWPADVAIDPSGRVLLDLTVGKPLRAFDLASGDEWGSGAAISTEPLVSESVAFAPGAPLCYVGVEDAVLVVDLEQRAVVERLDTGGFPMREFVLSEDGALLASRSRWSSVLLLDTRSGRSTLIPTGLDVAWDLDFDGSNRVLWLVDSLGAVTALDLRAGRLGFPGHDAAVTSVDLAPLGHLVVTGADDGSLRAWDWDTTDEVARLDDAPAAIDDLVVLEGGERVAAVGAFDGVALWSLLTGERTKQLTGDTAEEWTSVVEVEPGVVLTGGANAVARWRIGSTSERNVRESSTRVALGARVRALSLRPDGALAAAACEDGRVRLLDTASLAHVGLLTGHEAATDCAAFSPDGRLLASGGRDSTVLVHEIAGERLITRLRTGVRRDGPIRLRALGFSPDGARLAAATEDGRVLVWQTDTWESVLALEAHLDAVRDLRFRPDGVQLVTVSDDGSIGTWDTRTPSARILALEARARGVALWRPRFEALLASGAGVERALDALGEDASVRPLLRQLALGAR